MRHASVTQTGIFKATPSCVRWIGTPLHHLPEWPFPRRRWPQNAPERICRVDLARTFNKRK
jgi:hypothetical protein